MRMLLAASALALATAAAPAVAQDYPATTTTTDANAAPDGTAGFGIKPYFGVRGGWEEFDYDARYIGIPTPRQNNLNGAIVEGLVGVNVPVKFAFVGVEGNVAKGVAGDIDWEYGVAGRAGVRVGDSGLFYGKAGYRWTNFDARTITNRDFGDWEYGLGFEAGPKDIGLSGITGNAGIRLRGEVSTLGHFHSFRPTLGIITHF